MATRDKYGNVVGDESANGEIRNAAGNVLGYTQSNGDIRNSAGNVVGYTQSNGEVRNVAGNVVGYIQSNGDVRNAAGNVVGQGSGALLLLLGEKQGRQSVSEQKIKSGGFNLFKGWLIMTIIIAIIFVIFAPMEGEGLGTKIGAGLIAGAVISPCIVIWLKKKLG